MPSVLRSPRTWAAIGVGLGVLIALIAWFVPYLTRERQDVAGVPVPPPFLAQAPVEMRPGSEACMSDVAVGTDAELVELTTLKMPRQRPPMDVVVRAPGYRETAQLTGGSEPLTGLYARIDPPERSVIGTLCIRNRGDRRVELLGTTDARTGTGRPITRIEGEEVPDISVRLLSVEPGSVLERLGELVDRAAAFKPGVFGLPLLLWLMLLLTAIGLPAAATYAIVTSFRAAGAGPDTRRRSSDSSAG
jgi:hypothetical protein